MTTTSSTLPEAKACPDIHYFVTELYWNTDTAISTQSKLCPRSHIQKREAFSHLPLYLPSPKHCVFPAWRPSIITRLTSPLGTPSFPCFSFSSGALSHHPHPLGRGQPCAMPRQSPRGVLWAAFRDLIASLNLPPRPSTLQIKLPTSASCPLIWEGKKIFLISHLHFSLAFITFLYKRAFYPWRLFLAVCPSPHLNQAVSRSPDCDFWVSLFLAFLLRTLQPYLLDCKCLTLPAIHSVKSLLWSMITTFSLI